MLHRFRLIEQAKTEFERSARAMFQQTINLGKELRPNALWGFYGFPDCYGNKDNHYQCSDQVGMVSLTSFTYHL